MRTWQNLARLTVMVLVGSVILGCAPGTFVRTTEPGWREIEFAPNLSRDEAWYALADTIALKHDIALMDRESGYLRTAWNFTQEGDKKARYRTRIIAKIPPSNDKVRVRTVAHWLNPATGYWEVGIDTAELEDVWRDVQGRIGRVTR